MNSSGPIWESVMSGALDWKWEGEGSGLRGLIFLPFTSFLPSPVPPPLPPLAPPPPAQGAAPNLLFTLTFAPSGMIVGFIPFLPNSFSVTGFTNFSDKNQLKTHAIANLANTTARITTSDTYRKRLATKHPGVILSIRPATYRAFIQPTASWGT